MKKEYKLDDNRKKIKFRINTGTVTIYRDNILVPTLYYGDQFDIREKENNIKVTQKNIFDNAINIGGNTMIKSGGIVINSCNNISIVTGNNITIVNGKVVSGNVVNVKNIEPEDEELEFVVPIGVDDLSFDVGIDSGSLIVRDVLVSSMKARMESGTITMREVDMLKAELDLISGNIDLEIASSLLNYDTKLKTVCGKIKKESIDTVNNISQGEKRQLEAKVTSGNIKVLFKG